MVCHDGSPASETALDTISKGLFRDIDKLYIASAWSLTKEEYLPYNYKIDYIRDQNSTRFTFLRERFEFLEEEIIPEKDDTAKEVLNNLAKDNHIDVTVVGFHGRKGPKEDPTVMGSAIQFMSIHSYTPTMIIKQAITRENRPDGYSFGVCIDGSKKSM
jgi:hypothetical protein